MNIHKLFVNIHDMFIINFSKYFVKYYTTTVRFPTLIFLAMVAVYLDEMKFSQIS